ncbi:glycosyl hydrolase family 18 protein [Reichenbachiella versicolor]|uniref:glycosyl hydrolase family 18 protein n=1 Tax=Reichenbachiella versicolor TaxID=1821036 RepID=UPI000D6E1137|nr:glycosyl hydrolase family 18 protein [Reichenbachiella versicolor]
MKNALMVGYLQSWGSSNITFTEAVKRGYTTPVMAFGEINRSEVGIYGGAFAPSPTPEELKKDIQGAKENGAEQVLFSVGGGNNTYCPKNADVVTLAQNIVAYLSEYGFTGIDFDLELSCDKNDQVYLDQLCAEIKKLDESLIITAAPQLNQADHGSNLFLVSQGNDNIFEIAVANNRFDYLFVQAYNNGWPEVNGCKETDVCFISAAFNNLKNTIPSATKIVIGEPANNKAAGTSIFPKSDVPSDIYERIAKQYSSIHADEQFGGAMCWSVNLDESNDYSFVNAVGPVIDSSVPSLV